MSVFERKLQLLYNLSKCLYHTVLQLGILQRV